MFEGMIRVTGHFALGLTIIGLVFRSTLYWLIPVMPDEPFGLADIIELLIFYSLFGSGVFLIISSLVLAVFRKAKPAMKAFSIGLLSPLLYYVIHAYVPKLV
ncbi:hypothetical protein CLV44_12460 [Marinobacterium halophilum]|uniref:Uncharacterized protein n=1 Tax=Marinobacterium halophilum TaxID=267374 RepID=A0A2P8END3_9GAMM|nr:hypothetical protein CLV44_12460 [Marinobacterium halophilum]